MVRAYRSFAMRQMQSQTRSALEAKLPDLLRARTDRRRQLDRAWLYTLGAAVFTGVQQHPDYTVPYGPHITAGVLALCIANTLYKNVRVNMAEDASYAAATQLHAIKNGSYKPLI